MRAQRLVSIQSDMLLRRFGGFRDQSSLWKFNSPKKFHAQGGHRIRVKMSTHPPASVWFSFFSREVVPRWQVQTAWRRGLEEQTANCGPLLFSTPIIWSGKLTIPFSKVITHGISAWPFYLPTFLGGWQSQRFKIIKTICRDFEIVCWQITIIGLVFLLRI